MHHRNSGCVFLCACAQETLLLRYGQETAVAGIRTCHKSLGLHYINHHFLKPVFSIPQVSLGQSNSERKSVMWFPLCGPGHKFDLADHS